MPTTTNLKTVLSLGTVFALFLPNALAANVNWIPAGLPPAPEHGPALCQGDFLPQEVAAAMLEEALKEFPDRESWEAYVTHAKKRMLAGANLDPWPTRTPLNPIVSEARQHNGYSVANVAFESVPGYFVTGNLYRPTAAKPPYAAVLCPHGHAPNKRLGADMQARCGALARMGAVVLSLDMVGFAESATLVGADAHRRPFTLTLQSWNTRRGLDFLLSQPGTDPGRVAVTGGSGGGTQTFLLAANDPRVKLSVPVVMVSAHFFGGCDCESGLPIHRSGDHFANNVLIAAMAAPRPQLLVSDGGDWTANTPEGEFPFLRKIYAYHGAADQVANVHLPDEQHDYGPSKRAAMYRFVAEHFDLNLTAIQDDRGNIDESRVTVEEPDTLRVFPNEAAIPDRALRKIGEVEKMFRGLQ